MKKIIAFSFLLFSVTAYSQDDRRKSDSIALFAPTGKGLPDGEPVNEKIGNNGGRIISSDKKVEIIIPAGALQKETTISIQPVTSLSPAAIGKTYRFEPSGLQFKVPAKLVFHYSDEDTADGSPQLMSVSTQDAKGSWLRLANVKVDAELKTVTGTIMHFSEYVNSWTIVMWAHRNKVKVDNEVGVELYLTPINRSLDDASLKDFIDAHKQWFGLQEQNPRIWSVNGILRGNSTVGKIIDIKNEFNVIYKAPVKVPDWNPVDIQIEVKGIEFEGRLINVIRKCRVRVYDHLYKVNMISTWKGGTKASWGGVKTYSDEGSFIVNLDGKAPFLLDIKNNFETMTDNCKNVVLNPNSNTGLIHITQVQKISVTPPATPGGDRIVEVLFEKRKVEFTKVKYNCPPPPGFRGGSAQGNTSALVVVSVPAMPIYIKFIAKDEEQILEERGKPGTEVYLKIWVEKVKDE